MNLAITICATSAYTYAMIPQLRRVAANVRHLEGGHVVLVGDESPELAAVAEAYRSIMPEGWRIHLIAIPGLTDDHENYKTNAQMLIARLRTEAFTAARKLGATHCWSLDSDVLPPPNALKCSLQMLEFDDGHYSVSTCPYNNGMYLGGRGTPQNQIAEDFDVDERKLPWYAERAIAEARRRIANQFKTYEEAQKESKRMMRIEKRIKNYPTKGNVWTLNGERYRRRGWLENAYPGIGLGAVVPSDWCGFGCTLMNTKALDLAHFEGYTGAGTEDLYIVWNRWFPANCRINVITHCPCDHVIWEKKKGGSEKEYVLNHAYHELEGECIGHLRTRHIPWIPEN